MSYERGLFDTHEEVEEVAEIEEWVNRTIDGSRADLPWQPQPQVWDKVASDRDNCLGRNCETYDICFYFKARREMYNADLLIVNHHLLFSDLAIRKDSEAAMGVLPDYDYLIIDEAHHLEATATNHASIDFSNTRVKWLLDSLYNETKQRRISEAVRFITTENSGRDSTSASKYPLQNNYRSYAKRDRQRGESERPDTTHP